MADDDRPDFPPSADLVFGAGFVPRRAGRFGGERVGYRPDQSAPGGACLRVGYPAGSSSPNSHREYGSPEGGAQLYLPFAAGPAEQVRLRYHVRFEPGFGFARGGKLPGLYGGSHTSGGRIPDGTNGLSTRLMFRAGGAGELYAYLPSSERHGTSIGRGTWFWETGRWHSVEQWVRLNTPGRGDGAVVVAIDARTCIDVRDLTFRTSPELLIDGLYFSTFFGGSDPSWGSPRDQWAEFAGFSTRSGAAA